MTEPQHIELISAPFDATRITEVRHKVAGCAEAAGLAGQQLEDFVLAVNELVTNAVRHGGGQGALRVWRAGDRVMCEVTDEGAGITRGTGGWERPEPDIAGGWGMWLARQLSNTMSVATGPDGTTVRITALAYDGGTAAN
jgi:anti-sigma regulatory factor (Ser/Thr protein kinase)